MPPRKKVTLPDHVRNAVLADISLTHIRAVMAEEDIKVRVFLATEQGLDTYEIAEYLGNVSQPTVARWAQKGREIWERREKERTGREPARGQQSGEDPVRPGELEPLS